VLEHDLKGYDKDSPYFAVAYLWVDKWKKFIYNEGKPPPAIDNASLVSLDHTPLAQKQEGKDYIFVNSKVWMTWWLIYGGGPIIARKSPDLYSSNVLSTLWHMTIGNGKSDTVREPERRRKEERKDGSTKSDNKEERMTNTGEKEEKITTEDKKQKAKAEQVPEEIKKLHTTLK